ncbi:hypothetical protein [Marivita sp.]|uniref:hypothetical protein n=1 Tax=Marivita sp. TaxID=2003365 RepID=UPI00321B3692
MNTPEWLKSRIYGAVIGADFVGVIGFSWGFWVTGGTSNDSAVAMFSNDVVASMVSVCLDMARSDLAWADKLTTIRAASTHEKRSAVMTAGHATRPGTDAPDRDIAKACLKELELLGHGVQS